MTQAQRRRGFSVHVFLPSGDPDGVKVVEKDNWNGRGLVIPRAMFAETRSRDELARTGIYLLVGPSEGSALPTLYVGEGDPVRQRLDSHANRKDFWTHAVVFTSKDQNLNKAHVQHLEARLVELAGGAKRAVLENVNEPSPPSLSEADVASVEGFLDDMLLCLPLLGYGFFEASPEASRGTLTLFLRAKGIEGKGHDTAAGFVVLAGSQAVGDDKLAPSMHLYMRELRGELLRQGVLRPTGDVFVMTQDYTFASPSTASGVLLGRATNGRTDWKDARGRTLKEIQELAEEATSQ